MKKILLVLLVISIAILNAEMNQLRIEGKAKFQSGVIISENIVDKNMEKAALIVFLTDLTVDIDFRPSKWGS